MVDAAFLSVRGVISVAGSSLVQTPSRVVAMVLLEFESADRLLSVLLSEPNNALLVGWVLALKMIQV